MADILALACVSEDADALYLHLTSQGNNAADISTYIEIDKLNDDQFKTYFRFEKGDMERLCTALKLPVKIVCKNGTAVSGLEGLCILLRRLAYPNRLEDLEIVFNRPKYELSYIINAVLDLLHELHSDKLRNLNQAWLDEGHLRMYADAIYSLGAPLPNCWGFVDGTIRPICRPSENQTIVYSGHKRVHGLKFQSVVTPNGMIANLYGPVEARRHDSAMLRMSGLLPELEQHMTMVDGTIYNLYGDPAYPLRPHLIAPFRTGAAPLGHHEAIFNKRMSKLRSCVEWTFGKIISIFSFLDYKKNLKLYLQPVAKYYIVAAILTNCHTCLYGSETTEYFNVHPPSLEEYLQ